MDTLLIKNIVHNGTVCDIFIRGGIIEDITGDCSRIADRTIDGKGMTVIPSFVNMHTHSGMTLFRGICEDMPLDRWLDAVWKAEKELDSEMIYWATRLACLEMIKSGTTAFTDMYWYIDRGADAVAASGMKVLYATASWMGETLRNKNCRGRNAWKCTGFHVPGRKQ